MFKMNNEIRIEYSHYRVPRNRDTSKGEPPLCSLYKYYRGYKMKPNEKGGKTVCRIYHGDELVSIGTATCSMSDNFCYRIGREIAYGRACKKMAESEKCA